MDDLKRIVWLASYPKSGNTWFRVFLSNLLNKSDQPADINNLYTTPIASSRELFDEATGLSSSELTSEEIDLLRPHVYEFISRTSSELQYQKVHDAWQITKSGEPMFSDTITKCVIYFIRNPLDVAVSFSNHLSKSHEDIAKILADKSFAFSSNSNRFHLQFRQRLLSWSDHIHSWVDESGLPILVVRYEDMKDNTFETFKRAVNFLGLVASDEDIRKAIRFSDIKEMQKQESQSGFSEKPTKADSFFRKGEIGSWRSELAPELVNSICKDHREMMIRFGYLDDKGFPI